MRLDELNVRRALKQLDPDLYLTTEWDGAEFLCYAVYTKNVAPGDAPIRCALSRLDDGASMHMVEALVANEGDLQESWERVKKNNWDLKKKREKERAQALHDLMQEHSASTGKLRRWFGPGMGPEIAG